MSANIEFNSARNTNSFFSRKEIAWHGLGQVVQEAKTAEEALQLANLDYEVSLQPLYTSYIPDGCFVRGTEPHLEAYDKKTQAFIKEIQKKGELVTTHKSVSRMDNFTTLGIVGNKYTPVQNLESLNFIYDILKHNPDIKEKNDIIIETAGVLGVGERIFVTAKLPVGFKVGDETDTTDLYIVFTNSHNGTSSLTALITPIRVVCNNTLSAALKDNKAKVEFRHTKNIGKAMGEGLSLLKLSYDTFDTNHQLYNALLNIKVDSNLLDELIARAMLTDSQLFQVEKLGIDNVPTDMISTRTRNTLLDVKEFVEYGCGQQYNKGTAYWAYMGMNSYLNNGTSFKDNESKFNNLLGGTVSKQDARMLNTVKALL